METKYGIRVEPSDQPAAGGHARLCLEEALKNTLSSCSPQPKLGAYEYWQKARVSLASSVKSRNKFPSAITTYVALYSS